MSIIDDINASGLPAATRFVRLRASRKPDPYNPAQTTEDWTKPVELEVRGALASSSSTRTPDVLDVQTTSTAVLTVADPNADIRLGDRIRPEPADGRMWEVSGFPSGQTSIKFNDAFFDQILNSAGVRALTRGAAEKALGVAKANAPVDTGAYRDGLQVEAVQRAHRTTFMVVGTDAKTMLVESKTGNLRKALKAVKL